MTMGMRIGRVGADIAWSGPESWSESGDEVTVDGTLRGAGAEDLSWQRSQLLGLLSPDEPAVPVRVGFDDDRDGWFRVLDVGVDSILGRTESAGDRRWSATLRRLAVRQQPRYELLRFGTVVGNDHNVGESDADPFAALPAAAVAIDVGFDGSVSTSTNPTVDGGDVLLVTGSGDLYDHVLSAFLPLDDAYVGAARVEVDVTGSGDWRTLVGREMPNRPGGWRVGNGTIRAWWDTSAMGIARWDGSSWVISPERFALTRDGISFVPLGDPVSVSVLRNDPTRVTLRMVFDLDQVERVSWDLTVRRGDIGVIGVIKSRTSSRWGIAATPAMTDWTAVGDRAAARTNTFDGMRWVIASPRDFDVASPDSGMHLTDESRSFPHGISLTTGSGGVAADRYYAQPSELLAITGA